MVVKMVPRGGSLLMRQHLDFPIEFVRDFCLLPAVVPAGLSTILATCPRRFVCGGFGFADHYVNTSIGSNDVNRIIAVGQISTGFRACLSPAATLRPAADLGA
jgi:hypothetical protein